MLGVLSLFICSILFLGVYGQELPTCASSYGYGLRTKTCATPELEARFCPDGFTRVENYCFKVGDGNKNWKRSRHMCKVMGSKLAEPNHLLYNSTEFAEFLWEQGGIKYGFKGRTYSIGGKLSNNAWKWLSGPAVISNEAVNNFYGGKCLSIQVTKDNNNAISYQLQSIPCKPSKDMVWARAYRYVCQAALLKGFEPCYENERMYSSGQLVSMNAPQCQQLRCLNGKVEPVTCGNIETGCCAYQGVLYADGDIIGNAILRNCSTCEQRICQAGVIQMQTCTDCPEKCCTSNGESYLPGHQIKSGACSRLRCDGRTGEFENQGHDSTCQTCKVYLDPHIVTYDSSSVYSYQKCGNYTLSQFGTSYEPTTAVFGTFVPCGSGSATCLDTITYKNDEHTVITIRYDVNSSRVMSQVNGEDFTITSSQPSVISVRSQLISVQAWNKGGNCITLEGTSGIQVKFCGSSRANSAYLWASPVIAGELRGLCGTVNDNVDDDFTPRDGNITAAWSGSPPNEFTSSWMVSNTSSDDCGIPQAKNRCEDNSTIEEEYKIQCTNVIKNIYANAEPEDLQSVIDACVIDLCNVDDPEDWIRVVRETTQVQATILEESLIFQECGTETSQNGTYFINNNYPKSYDGVDSCELTVKKMNPNICQLRLDFVEMILANPNSSNHECLTDRFMVSGSSSDTPIICGTNTGNHMYVNMDPADEEEPIRLSFITVGPSFNRKWKIKVSQIPCNAVYAAPNHCLQYFQTGLGRIESFNFNASSGLQLSNQDYTVCVRNEKNFCGIEYTPCEDTENDISQSFSLTGNIPNRHGSLAGSINCSNDWLIIPCVSDNSTNPWSNCEDRLCGDSFNIVPSTTAGHVPLYSYVKPFTLVYHTDGQEINSTSLDKGNKGFCLDYVQQPCV